MGPWTMRESSRDALATVKPGGAISSWSAPNHDPTRHQSRDRSSYPKPPIAFSLSREKGKPPCISVEVGVRILDLLQGSGERRHPIAVLLDRAWTVLQGCGASGTSFSTLQLLDSHASSSFDSVAVVSFALPAGCA